MPTKLTLEDLEALRQQFGIAQDLLEDLEQVGVLEEVGIAANQGGPGAVGH
jgi:hypothetical protein